MSEQQHRWIVDVLEEHSAAIEIDGERVVTVPRWLLPADAREGHVYAVRHERDETFSRITVEIDQAAGDAALEASRQQLASAPDGGQGDITL